MKADLDIPVVPTPGGQRQPRSSGAARLLAALALGGLLYVAHAAFIPIALAVLFALILTTPVEALHRRGLPRSAAALLMLFVIIGLLGVAVNLLWAPAQQWWTSAPHTIHEIERKARPLTRLVGRLEMLTTRAGQIGAGAAPLTSPAAATRAAPEPAPPPPVGPPNIAVLIFDQTRTVIVAVVATTIVTLFLLAGGPPLLARLSAAASADHQSARMLTVINAVRSEVSRYYASIALINIGLGTVTAIVTKLLGMPNPLLWGATAAVLNFIPYVGSAVTLSLLTLVAFVSFESLGRVAAMAASYLVIATLEGQVVQPLVVGRRLELNPIIVFLALWFGGWFWGIAGIVMAVPSLVTLKVIAEHSRKGGPLTEFLSPHDGSPVKALSARANKSFSKGQRSLRA